MLVSEYNAKYSHPVLKKDFERHKRLIQWFIALCEANGIKWWPYGYEDMYELEDFLKIMKSDDYYTRLRPDLKIFWKGKYYLVDLKSSRMFIPALALLLNTKREHDVLYILDKTYIVKASDIVDNQEKYLQRMIIFSQKKEKADRLNPCKEGFHVEHYISDKDIGAVWTKERGWFWRSGDTCVVLLNDAPIEFLRLK